MLYDHVNYLSQLPLPSNSIDLINEFLKTADALPEGRYELDGRRIYASKFSYATKSSPEFEGHRQYTDLQILLSGEERLDVTPFSPGPEQQPYDETGDAVIFTGRNAVYSSLALSAGYFALLLPRDFHRPGQPLNQHPAQVTKLVIKIAVDAFH